MNFVRKFALVLITPILSLLLFATAFDMGVLRVVGQSSNVKQILRDSGVYNTAVNSVLDQSKQVTDGSSGADIDLSNSTIRQAANSTITPQYVQQQSEGAIDSVYAWLNGKTAQPDFNLDISSLKGKFASQVAAAVQKQAASLPACSDGASASAALNDPIAASCLPPGVTPAAAASEAEGDLLNGQGFLDKTSINLNDLKDNKTNQPLFTSNAKVKDLPKQYQRVKKLPIILSILTLLTAAAIVFLNTNRRKGLHHVGVVVLTIGLFMLLLAWGLSEAISKEIPKIKIKDNAVVQTDVQKVVKDIAQQVDGNYWIFGGVYSVLGALAIGGAMFMKKQGGKDDLEGEGRTAADRIDLKAPDKPMSISTGKDASPKKLSKTTKP